MLLLKRLALLLLLWSCRGAAPAAVDAGPSEWPLYAGDGFEVRMPGVPAVSPTQRAESDMASLAIRAVSYVSPDRKAQFGVVTFEFPTVSGPIAFASPLYMAVHDRVIRGSSARVVSDVSGTWYSLAGHALELERPPAGDAPAAHISGRLVVKDRRLYFVSIVRDLSAPEALARRYLDSFELTR